MIDFSQAPVIDNHCHPSDFSKQTLSADELAREVYHGMGDTSVEGVKAKNWPASDKVVHHFRNLGVGQTMVNQLAKVFDCDPILETVAEERNRRTANGFAEYAKLLYDDANIKGTVVDSGLPAEDPAWGLFPGEVLKMFQFEPAMNQAMDDSQSFREARTKFLDILERAVRDEGKVGVKSHLAERVGFNVDFVSDADAERLYGAAKKGHRNAWCQVYVAMFTATLLKCQDLNVPVHLHTGITGGLWEGPIHNADPFLLVDLIRRPEFLKTEIVLLHCAYPWIQNAAAVAHALPHVWVDMGWTTPWISLRIVECYRDAIGMAPLSKLMIGSGGHGTPEIAWLAGKTAKIALGEALGDTVRLGLLSQDQAERAGRMILHDNAVRMYGLDN